MSKRNTKRQHAEVPAPSESVAQEIRIDSAHAIEGHSQHEETVAAEAVVTPAAAHQAESDTSAPASSTSGGPEPTQALQTAQRLYTQATQLAAQLQTRQQTLDRREAQLNARLAQLDQGTRAARLWVNEREAEIAARLASLDAQQREVTQRIERLATVETTSDRKLTAMAQGQEELALREQRLSEQTADLAEARRRHEAEAQRAADALVAERQQIDAQRESSLAVVRQAMAGLERRREALEQQAQKLETEGHSIPADLVIHEQQLRAQRETLDARASVLEQTEVRLAAMREDAERLAADLRRQQAALDEAGRAQRRRLAVEQRQAQAELDRQREAIQRRGQQVDQAKAATEQLRAEVGQIHRESLELRLATEQAWLQLCSSASPTELTRSLAEIRARLSDAYRDANDELRRRKEDLEAIRNQMVEQHQELMEKKHEFDAWAERRQAEIESMAQRLVAREQELHAQEVELADRARSMDIERIDFQPASEP
jgi:chromosome segregation protein